MKNKRIGFIALILAFTFFAGIFSSCSNKGCLYSHKRYRKSSALSKGSNLNKPGRTFHQKPLGKKWVIHHKKKNILK